MASTSKPKQLWQVKEEQKRNWLEVPDDITANILHRIGVYDILENAQKVCTTWRKICKDPAMWRVVYMDNYFEQSTNPSLRVMCKHAVDRSQGQLVDLTIGDFANDELLRYVADRSSQLRRLVIDSGYDKFYESWSESLKKFPLLEELNLYTTDISKEGIETAGRCCPMLRTLKVNRDALKFWDGDEDDEIAIAIGENLPELRHLQLLESKMTNSGLQVILDGCCNLESLDLRSCLYIDLKGDLGKKCSNKIKCLKLPTGGARCNFFYGYGDSESDYEF